MLPVAISVPLTKSFSHFAVGIVLSWNMTLGDSHAQITNYQLFAYQEGTAMPVAALWKKVLENCTFTYHIPNLRRRYKVVC